MDQLLQYINQELSKDKDTFVEINMMELLQHWQMNNVQDIDITRKLLAFSKGADLKYLSVLVPNSPAIVRFWRDDITKLPQEEGLNEQDSN